MTPDTSSTPSRRAMRAARESTPEGDAFGDAAQLFGSTPPPPADAAAGSVIDGIPALFAPASADLHFADEPAPKPASANEQEPPVAPQPGSNTAAIATLFGLGGTDTQSTPTVAAEPVVIEPLATATPKSAAPVTSTAAVPGFAASPFAAPAPFASTTPLTTIAPEVAAPTVATLTSAPPAEQVDSDVLGWVVPAALTPVRTLSDPDDDVVDLVGHRPRKKLLRSGVVVPTLVTAAVLGAYAAGTLLWPLHAVAPTIEEATVTPVAHVAATPAWPAAGSAAIAVEGIDGTLASADAAPSIASITKVVTALLVLEESPLAVGEAGPSYKFTSADRSAYWRYRNNGESALDVPVGGSLTQYQMLQGMLIGSANNYADRLATRWPSDRVFAAAANDWLASHGVPGITIVDPTGIESGNVASPAALITLAEKALANPVIAEIVRTPSVDLPGAGTVKNTNGLLADPGVIGIKTGSLDAFNLLTAKDITVGETPVRLYAATLGQPDWETRDAATRALFAQLEAELQLVPSVVTDTVAGYVVTPWGERVPVTTSSDASVVLWNGGSGAVTTTFDLGDENTAGANVGSLTVDGPLDSATVELKLTEDVEPPSAWWRLTHPLQLLGLAD